jgi:putative ABC transport system substrate-binding protein
VAITIKRREVMTPLSGAAARRLVIQAQQQPWKMLRTRIALLTMLALFAPPLGVEGQQIKKIPRLCFLTFDPGTLQSRSPRFDAFFKGLRELGYVDGQTITIDYLSANGRNERFPALAAECLHLNADIIAVTITPGAHAAKSATRTIPIVMLSLGDPMGTGLVDNLARPGGNITGAAQMTSELAPKRLELLKQAVPGISRVLVLSYLVDPIAPLQVKSLEAAAPSLGVRLQIREIRNGDDLPAAFDAAASEGAEAVFVTTESVFVVHRARLTELAARYRLPAMYSWSLIVTDANGLMAYDVNEPDLHRHAATYVDRILKGAKPSDLPIHGPTNLKLVVNIKTAKTLGLSIPPSLLARADEVIE